MSKSRSFVELPATLWFESNDACECEIFEQDDSLSDSPDLSADVGAELPRTSRTVDVEVGVLDVPDANVLATSVALAIFGDSFISTTKAHLQLGHRISKTNKNYFFF